MTDSLLGVSHRGLNNTMVTPTMGGHLAPAEPILQILPSCTPTHIYHHALVGDSHRPNNYHSFIIQVTPLLMERLPRSSTELQESLVVVARYEDISIPYEYDKDTGIESPCRDPSFQAFAMHDRCQIDVKVKMADVPVTSLHQDRRMRIGIGLRSADLLIESGISPPGSRPPRAWSRPFVVVVREKAQSERTTSEALVHRRRPVNDVQEVNESGFPNETLAVRPTVRLLQQDFSPRQAVLQELQRLWSEYCKSVQQTNPRSLATSMVSAAALGWPSPDMVLEEVNPMPPGGSIYRQNRLPNGSLSGEPLSLLLRVPAKHKSILQYDPATLDKLLTVSIVTYNFDRLWQFHDDDLSMHDHTPLQAVVDPRSGSINLRDNTLRLLVPRQKWPVNKLYGERPFRLVFTLSLAPHHPFPFAVTAANPEFAQSIGLENPSSISSYMNMKMLDDVLVGWSNPFTVLSKEPKPKPNSVPGIQNMLRGAPAAGIGGISSVFQADPGFGMIPNFWADTAQTFLDQWAVMNQNIADPNLGPQTVLANHALASPNALPQLHTNAHLNSQLANHLHIPLNSNAHVPLNNHPQIIHQLPLDQYNIAALLNHREIHLPFINDVQRGALVELILEQVRNNNPSNVINSFHIPPDWHQAFSDDGANRLLPTSEIPLQQAGHSQHAMAPLQSNEHAHLVQQQTSVQTPEPPRASKLPPGGASSSEHLGESLHTSEQRRKRRLSDADNSSTNSDSTTTSASPTSRSNGVASTSTKNDGDPAVSSRSAELPIDSLEIQNDLNPKKRRTSDVTPNQQNSPGSLDLHSNSNTPSDSNLYSKDPRTFNLPSSFQPHLFDVRPFSNGVEELLPHHAMNLNLTAPHFDINTQRFMNSTINNVLGVPLNIPINQLELFLAQANTTLDPNMKALQLPAEVQAPSESALVGMNQTISGTTADPQALQANLPGFQTNLQAAIGDLPALPAEAPNPPMPALTQQQSASDSAAGKNMDPSSTIPQLVSSDSANSQVSHSIVSLPHFPMYQMDFQNGSSGVGGLAAKAAGSIAAGHASNSPAQPNIFPNSMEELLRQYPHLPNFVGGDYPDLLNNVSSNIEQAQSTNAITGTPKGDSPTNTLEQGSKVNQEDAASQGKKDINNKNQVAAPSSRVISHLDQHNSSWGLFFVDHEPAKAALDANQEVLHAKSLQVVPNPGGDSIDQTSTRASLNRDSASTSDSFLDFRSSAQHLDPNLTELYMLSSQH